MNQNQPQEFQRSLSGAGGNWQVEQKISSIGLRMQFFYYKVMKIQILEIEATPEKGTFITLVLVGKKHHKFIMNVESATVANQEVQVTNGDNNSLEFFRFNQIGASAICKLVNKIYNHQVVKLPAYIE